MVETDIVYTLHEEIDNHIYLLLQSRRENSEYLLATFENDTKNAINYFITNKQCHYSDFETFDHISSAIHNTWLSMEDEIEKNEFNTIISSKKFLEEIIELFSCRFDSPW